MCFPFSIKEPVWYEVGTQIGTARDSTTPENISDGFYYVPFLSTLQALLSNENIFNQVNIIGYTILVGLLASMHAFPKLC